MSAVSAASAEPVAIAATTRRIELADGVKLEVLDTGWGNGRGDERGIDERGIDERGIDERGIDERGIDERGVDERGVDERGMDERGIDGQGMDGRGGSSERVVRDERCEPGRRGRRAVPLLLLHGFTGAAATWTTLLPAFAPHRRVVAISLHGHGASDAPLDPACYAAPRAASDLMALLDVLALERVAVLGYSMGGRVALHLALSMALAEPARLAALVLESASPGIADAAAREARRAADAALADDLEREGVPAFVDRWERLPLWESQRTLESGARERLRAQRLASSALGLANSLRGVGAGATLPLHHRLPELIVPTLVICGEEDAKYAAIAREMAAALPHARLSMVAGAGHTVHLEQPRAFARAVNDFLDEVALGVS